jgi:hypothetical protein
MSTFPTYRQLDAMDCGPACIRMVAKHQIWLVKWPDVFERQRRCFARK